MLIVLLCAVGVGGATMVGALIGFAFRGFGERFLGVTLGFAAGVSLAAAVLGLILPSLEYGGEWGIVTTVIGIFLGAALVSLLERLLPIAERKFLAQGARARAGASSKASASSSSSERGSIGRVLLLVMAIAMHNLPEGIAAGVGFGGEDVSGGILIAIGIALQNLPEGMIIIAPMLSIGVSPRVTLITALLTGVVEVVGTFIGYFAVSIAEALLPFSLAFAGGTMLYVVECGALTDDTGKGSVASGFAMIVGFSLMLIFDQFL